MATNIIDTKPPTIRRHGAEGCQKCHSTATVECVFLNSCELYCLAKDSPPAEMDPLASQTFYEVWHIFCTILPSLSCFAFARICTNALPNKVRNLPILRFLFEFMVIVVPVVVSINVANEYVLHFNIFCIAVLLLLISCRQWLPKARERYFEIGKRPVMLTLARATINLLTAICILAIDFNSFPKEFRKSRAYGASLMDVGIGLFVYSMGTVSRRPHRPDDIVRLLRVVAPVLALGLARTVVIMAIDYHQDEHEYGVHLNAFFTLGLTKLFGTLLSAVATADVQLIYLGAGVLCVHELVLQFGMASFVLDGSVERSNFFSANREGLCSLPGYIGIYLISMYIGRWLHFEHKLSFTQFGRKLASMAAVSGSLWIVTVVSVAFVQISRVTSNFGYAVWILSIAMTMTTLFSIVFDLILDTLFPVTRNPTSETERVLKDFHETSPSQVSCIPSLVEAINVNGLIFFLLANILTGGVNIFLKPENRTDAESVVVLTIYMLIATGFVYILLRSKIRIA